jgi:DNA-binding PadR family transcriptional regulator
MSVADGLLVLLAEEPKHGYQLATDFGERTAGRWSLNTGQVYTTLDRLARDGFVVDDGTVDPEDARRRRWRLTDAGRDRARTWLTRAPDATGDRDELVLRVALAAGSSPDLALRVVDAQRAVLVDRLQQVRRAGPERGPDDGALLDQLAADAGAVRLEAQLRWLDLAEGRLRAVRPAPVHPAPEGDPR